MGPYGRAMWSIWVCNMDYMAMQHVLYGRTT
jgi:hypothetical protein